MSIGIAIGTHTGRGLRLPYLAYTQKVKALAPLAYWPLADTSGTTIADESGNARTGTYTAVTLAQAGIGDGRTAASLDGATSVGNIYSASYAAALNGAEGTVAVWAKVASAGVWTDGTARRVFRLATGTVNNRIEAYRTTVNGQLEIDYVAGGVAKGATIASGSPAGWFHLAISWSVAGDAVKLYFNGVQSGATLTGLGTWAGTVSTTQNVIGANVTTPASVWSGLIAHMALWATPLSAAQIASLAVVP